MNWLEVLVEGRSDVPVVREILVRKFGLLQGKDFQIISHTGRGSLPDDPFAPANPKHTALLDQLPAKLLAYASLPEPAPIVLVLVDVDDTPCDQMLRELNVMLGRIGQRPMVMFRLAIKEMESWFVADINALRAAYPGKLKKAVLRDLKPDTVVDAWELLARALGVNSALAGESKKMEWAQRISPYLNLENPLSPSLGKFLEGINRLVKARAK